ncbi:TetR/AcrR family transcriptional regulator C-terminal domain-containing protein [Pontibaca methylaminivorans]|uniref:Transcriptional regulator, TetR family n=1 Tax=Pontibaca methylaminivorans TaxID=515897 RepID=A0A1R3WKS2_9RHOB|nr:TetR/AcrR family transcriptional regulator C-terminal domain-containing protein [Pontibaca methylaminivorans]SIT77884.1 transcriptional regulator, TetR family [Pontibaca methylaminivorans]
MAKNGRSGTDRGSSTIWLKPAKRARDVPALTRDRIVQAAVEILDMLGQDGLTIRKLAEHLNAGAASLYWHVETRDDVLELALDSVLGEIPLPTEPLEWEKEVARFLTEWRQTLLRHPWSTSLFGFRPLLGPNALARSEHLRATLKRTGLPEVDVVHAGYTLSNFMLGSVATQVAWQAGNEAETRARVTSFLRENAAEYPALSSQIESEPDDWDESFSRGLGWIIRSLAIL